MLNRRMFLKRERERQEGEQGSWKMKADFVVEREAISQKALQVVSNL